MSLWDRLDSVRAEWDVLRHPFYERWSKGELLRDELARYSGQYRHAVNALADASATAAKRTPPGELRRHFEEHAREEAGHVELWDGFVDAVDGDTDAEPTPETARCAAAWAGAERGETETLAALFAIESAQPAIAETKLHGLLGEYGFSAGASTVYFEVHSTLDCEHAAAHREWIESRLDEADEDALVEAARDVLAANWELLDGVDRLNGS
jgi:pyrroloquinoline-quinone synthase